MSIEPEVELSMGLESPERLVTSIISQGFHEQFPIGKLPITMLGSIGIKFQPTGMHAHPFAVPR